MSRPLSDPGWVIPSWLISLVVHLAGLLVLALLTLPAEDRNLLAVYVGEQLEQREEALVTIESVDTLVEDLPQERAERRFEAIGGASEAASQLAAHTPIELASYDLPATGSAEETSLVPAGSVLLTVVAPRRGRQTAARTPAGMGGESPAQSLANSSSPADQIVHNFILYDIGQLGGEAGQRARADFEALGSDAIESLVRGLNASAYISASCPVIVLESKLRSTLREANDPAKYRFALQHVGRGVVPQAPYAGRLASLRQQLAVESGLAAGGATATAGGAAATTGGPGDQRAMLLQRMRRQSVHHLRRDLASAEPEVRAAAAQTVGSRGIQLVDELIPLLSDTDPSVRQEAHQALVRLGRGVDFGPNSSLASPDEIHEASLLWHDWWQQNKDRQGISEDTPKQADERLAEQKLRQAEQLLLGGREEAAQRRLRELVAEFPRTAAAERAHTYLTP